MIARKHDHGPDALITFIKPGERVQIQFVPRKPGRYVIYCMIEGHTKAPSPLEESRYFMTVLPQ